MQQNDDDNGSVESWSPTIKSRWRFSIEELRVLEATYHHSSNPRQEIVNRLAYTLQCPKKTVTTWFQNRRAKLKRQRLLQQEKEQKEPLQESEQQPPSFMQQHYYSSSHPEIDSHYQEWLLQEQEQERQHNNETWYTNFNPNISQGEQPLSFIITGGILTSQQQQHYNRSDAAESYPLQHTGTKLRERTIGDQQQQQREFLEGPENPTSCLHCSMQNEQHQQQYHHYGSMTSSLFPIDCGYGYCTTNSHVPCYSDNYNVEDTYSFLF